MKIRNVAVALLLSFAASTIAAQSTPPTAAYREWARTHAHRFSVSDTTSRARDLQAIDAIVGKARIVAVTEPFHGGHEPLEARNRIIRHLVTSRGFTAVALETGLAQSKSLYDFVLGTTPDADSVIRGGFTYGFGALPENIALLRWLRAYNAKRPANARVHLYGIDLPGQLTSDAFAALDRTFTSLDRIAPSLGAAARAQFGDIAPLFTARRFLTLSPAERDRVRGKVVELVSFVRRERITLTGASSRDEYEWVLRQAVNAEQDATFMRSVPPDFFGRMEAFLKGDTKAFAGSAPAVENSAVREMTMAENVAWVMEREGPKGRIVSFAHNAHQQTQPMELDPNDPLAGLMQGLSRAGRYAQSTFGRQLVTIGTYFGTFEGGPPSPVSQQPDANGMEGMLGALALPSYVADLRTLPQSGALHDWFAQRHPTRIDFNVHKLSPLEGYDAILYIERIVPVGMAK